MQYSSILKELFLNDTKKEKHNKEDSMIKLGHKY